MFFVVFEGVDGVGKTSIINKLTFRKKTVKKSFERDGIFTKELMTSSDIETSTKLFLFLTRRFDQQFKNYKEWRNNQFDILIQDRYYDSSYVYQHPLSALPDLQNLIYYETLPIPQLTIILDASVNTILKRKKEINDNFSTNNKKIISERRQLYLQLPFLFPKRKFVIVNNDTTKIQTTINTCKEIILSTCENDQNQKFHNYRYDNFDFGTIEFLSKKMLKEKK